VELCVWEEHRLREFENKVLKRVSGPQRTEIKGSQRKTA
jgi:hypothetical protein